MPVSRRMRGAPKRAAACAAAVLSLALAAGCAEPPPPASPFLAPGTYVLELRPDRGDPGRPARLSLVIDSVGTGVGEGCTGGPPTATWWTAFGRLEGRMAPAAGYEVRPREASACQEGRRLHVYVGACCDVWALNLHADVEGPVVEGGWYAENLGDRPRGRMTLRRLYPH